MYTVYFQEENHEFEQLWQLLEFAERCAANQTPLNNKVVEYQPVRGNKRFYVLFDHGKDIVTTDEEGVKHLKERWELVHHVPSQWGMHASDWAD